MGTNLAYGYKLRPIIEINLEKAGYKLVKNMDSEIDAEYRLTKKDL